jgi:hypothetical protein
METIPTLRMIQPLLKQYVKEKMTLLDFYTNVNVINKLFFKPCGKSHTSNCFAKYKQLVMLK